MKTVTATMKAWIPSHSVMTPADLAKGQINGLHYYEHDMSSAGWTLAGEADITVRLVDTKTLIENKVKGLREESKSIRAEATARCTQIDRQIQTLLALPFDQKVDA